jgi:hypothetical protein
MTAKRDGLGFRAEMQAALLERNFLIQLRQGRYYWKLMTDMLGAGV